MSIKEFSLEGVLNCPETETEDSVLDKFIAFVEANGWQFGGMVKDISHPEQARQDETR